MLNNTDNVGLINSYYLYICSNEASKYENKYEYRFAVLL